MTPRLDELKFITFMKRQKSFKRDLLLINKHELWCLINALENV